jgi:hypothetical protein
VALIHRWSDACRTARYAILLLVSLSQFSLLAAGQTVAPTTQSSPPAVAATEEKQPDPDPASGSGSVSDSGSVLNGEAAGGREVSLRRLVPNILEDQKPIWSFPLHVVKGEHLKPTLIVAGATAALVALDPHDEPYFRNNSGFKSFKTGPLRGRNTSLGITLAPAGLYLAGLAKKDSYAETTALLAAEALADTQILSLGMKGIDGRLHPSDIPVHGDFTHTWFKYGGTVFNPGSFPSGHATSAFAVASVFSARYGRRRWVPWVAYGLATFVSLSRIPDQAHFPSDVFAGAALGYAVSRFVVLPR